MVDIRYTCDKIVPVYFCEVDEHVRMIDVCMPRRTTHGAYTHDPESKRALLRAAHVHGEVPVSCGLKGHYNTRSESALHCQC